MYILVEPTVYVCSLALGIRASPSTGRLNDRRCDLARDRPPYGKRQGENIYIYIYIHREREIDIHVYTYATIPYMYTYAQALHISILSTGQLFSLTAFQFEVTGHPAQQRDEDGLQRSSEDGLHDRPRTAVDNLPRSAYTTSEDGLHDVRGCALHDRPRTAVDICPVCQSQSTTAELTTAYQRALWHGATRARIEAMLPVDPHRMCSLRGRTVSRGIPLSIRVARKGTVPAGNTLIYIYIYIYIHTYIHTCVYIHICVYISIAICNICVCIYIYIYIYIYMFLFISV